MDRDHQRSLASLLAELRDSSLLLLRQEFALAQKELSQSTKAVARQSLITAIGAAIAGMGALFLLTGMCILLFIALRLAGLSPEMAAWLAPMIFGLALVAAGYLVLMPALRNLKHHNLKPELSLRSLEESKIWLQSKAS